MKPATNSVLSQDRVQYPLRSRERAEEQRSSQGGVKEATIDLESNNSLFQNSWWLEAVAPGDWGEARIDERGAATARFPYVKKKKFGFTFIFMPPLTQTLGPWLRASGNKPSQVALQRKMVVALLEQLPPHDFFFQNFHHSVTDWLPFYWRGFQQRTRYTYVLDDLSDLDRIWQGMDTNVRRHIRNAEKKGIKVVQSDDLDSLLDLAELTYKRQDLDLPFSRDLVQRIDAACKPRDARTILLAYDQQGNLHNGSYLVHDRRAAYALIGGSDPQYVHSGANRLSLWESIKFAATRAQAFDFEGSMLEAIEPVFRDFGAIQKPYFEIVKINSTLLRMAYDMSNWCGALGKVKKLVER